MRGELDDALARLERRDEVRRLLTHEANGVPEELLDEVLRAVAAILVRRGTGTVTVSVPGPTGPATAELTVRAGTVQVATPVAGATLDTAPPPSAPTASGSPTRASRSAANLAELIRQNPALLDGLRPGSDPTTP
jgi:hypothetical protein